MDEKKLIFKKRLKGKHQYNNCVLSNAPMAQWITRLPSKQKIVGSIPTRSTLNAPVAKWIRRLPSKQKIVGSSPTGGSF